MDKAKLDEIRARLEKVTPGPWTVKKNTGFCDCIADEECMYDKIRGEWCFECPDWVWEHAAQVPEILTIDLGDYDGMNDNDAEFIAHAREDIPLLVEALEAETARADKAEQLFGSACLWRDTYKQERDKWKTRAEYFENYIKKCMSPCDICVYQHELADCPQCMSCKFDESGFVLNEELFKNG